ncbi:unnamed protein product [Thelazia callipaeda]|uniref:RICTOR_V domain-containing protein n=1 Tax=Thelazia callipaeda TaxID=103827 RepID=A0A0N5D2U2_THECL|nr:unnamed protein product [Thelazia callipaeda]
MRKMCGKDCRNDIWGKYLYEIGCGVRHAPMTSSFSSVKKQHFRFLDLVKDTTNVEYVKLIVACLDYSTNDCSSRVILQTALTSACEAGRKWSTRFLSILASHNLDNFGEWGMELLFAQLADPSAKVVRHALRLLHRWIPHYPDSVHMIEELDIDAFGDAGILLQAHLFSDENCVKNSYGNTLTVLDYWKKKFNIRYAEIIDENVKVALLDSKRSIDGRYARPSNERSAKFGVPIPVHLYGQLARHNTGRELLLSWKEVERLLNILRNSPLSENIYRKYELKSSLYALGHIVAAMNLNLLPKETLPIICRFAESCPILSIRGAAFWVLNLIGNTKHGSEALSRLGWENSSFLISEKSSESLPLFKGNENVDKSWIRCIDEISTFQHKNSYDFDNKIATMIMREQRAGSTVKNNLDEEDLTSRNKRAFAMDSTTTSDLNSGDELDCELFCPDELNSSAEVISEYRVFDSDNLVLADENTIETAEEDFQNCLMIRRQFRLRPFSLDRMITAVGSFGSVVNYFYMSECEFSSYCGFRDLTKGSCAILPHNLNTSTTKVEPVSLFAQSITLPRNPDLLCRDIFVEQKASQFSSVNDEQKHQMINCLNCSWPEEYFGSKSSFIFR